MNGVLGGRRAAGPFSAALRAGVTVALLCVAGRLDAQAGAIFGIVRGKANGEPLAYGIASVDGDARTMFISDSGRFLFLGVAPGKHTVQVRRLGFAPIQVAIDIRVGVTDTLRFELQRVAVTLDRVAIVAPPKCTAPGIKATLDTAIVPIVAQVVLNADYLHEVSKDYPYEYDLEVRRVRSLRNDSAVVPDDVFFKTYHSKTRASYRPGRALVNENGRWAFRIPELQDLANPAFRDAHCWHYAGADTIDGKLQYRVNVIAAASIRGVDVNGTIWIDAESFQVRRTEMRTDRRPEQMRSVSELVVTTDFGEILPSVLIIAHVYAVQVFDPAKERVTAELRENQRAIAFRFLGRRPGGQP